MGDAFARAGAAIGAGYTGVAEMQFKRLSEEEREARAMARAEALERLKEEREVAKTEREAQERSTIAIKATERADAIATNRFETPLGKDAAALAKSSALAGEQGDGSFSEDQLKEILRNDPKLRESYVKSGLIGGALSSSVDPRLQRATDEEQAARELGAKPTVLEGYNKAKRDVLAQIAQENKDKATQANLDNQGRKTDALIERLGSQNKTDKQNADSRTTSAGAAVTRAERPAATGSGRSGESIDLRGLQAESTAASRAVSEARKSRDAQQKVVTNSYGADKTTAQAALAEANKRLDIAETEASRARGALTTFNSGRAGAPAPAAAPAATTSTRPPLSSFAR